MRTYPNTLLDESCRLAVRRQMDYAAACGVPWGISESAYNLVDRHGTYQYKAFGIPGLGLKRGLGDELVVAPYATALAVMIDPAASTANLRRLAAHRPRGRVRVLRRDRLHPSRARRHRVGRAHAVTGVVVPAYLAHHEGMTLVALTNALLGDRMVERFHAEPRVQATELLLQERVPRDVGDDRTASARRNARGRAGRVDAGAPLSLAAHAVPAHAVPLERQLRHVGDQRRRRRQRLARPAGDAVAPRRHARRRRSVHLPARRAQRDRVVGDLSADPARARRLRRDLFGRPRELPAARRRHLDALDIAVSTEDDVEVRRITVRNHGTRIRELDVTSYAEIVLTSAVNDLAHPAFGKLFVETEYLPDSAALLCHRRPRDPGDVRRRGPSMP